MLVFSCFFHPFINTNLTTKPDETHFARPLLLRLKQILTDEFGIYLPGNPQTTSTSLAPSPHIGDRFTR